MLRLTPPHPVAASAIAAPMMIFLRLVLSDFGRLPCVPG